MSLGGSGADFAENDPMDREKSQVTACTDLRCLECERDWTEPSERWRMYATTGPEPDVGLYCPSCAAFEFGA
jgi:hypothetical protein